MNIKSLLLGSAAALVAVSGARAADAVVAAEPEPVEYVRVCDAFGKGYFYIPGTETCLKIGGYMQYDVGVGDLFAVTSNTGDETYFKRTRASLTVTAKSDTELGELTSFLEARWNWSTTDTAAGYDTGAGLDFEHGWIQLGGLRLGKTHSTFTTWTGYAGNVVNDGTYGVFSTNLISYTYTGGAWKATIALEQGDDSGVAGSWGIDDYVPHVVVGLGGSLGMVDLTGVFGWDSRDGAAVGGWAGKIRADVKINDAASVFAMLMYGENSSAYTAWRAGAVTDSTFSVIGGATYKFSDKGSFNLQGQWIDGNAGNDRWSVVANVAYDVVPGLKVTPEVVWSDNGTTDQVGGWLRVRRSF